MVTFCSKVISQASLLSHSRLSGSLCPHMALQGWPMSICRLGGGGGGRGEAVKAVGGRRLGLAEASGPCFSTPACRFDLSSPKWHCLLPPVWVIL